MTTIVKISASDIPGMINIVNKSLTIDVNQRPNSSISRLLNTQDIIYAKAQILPDGSINIKGLVPKSKWL